MNSSSLHTRGFDMNSAPSGVVFFAFFSLPLGVHFFSSVWATRVIDFTVGKQQLLWTPQLGLVGLEGLRNK